MYLELQKGKDTINTLKFQQYIGVIATFTNRITNATNGCDQLSSNDTLFADDLFRIVKTVEENNS